MEKVQPTHPIAVIGIGCWYPGARNPREFWENILARRRQFRRMPDQRLPLADYHDPDRSVPDKTYGKMAAVIDGFEFDWAARRVPLSTFNSTDVAHWLAVEVALNAVADAGYDKKTIDRERAGVIVGNSLTGEMMRSNYMRQRWPYVRRVFWAAARSRGLPDNKALQIEAALEAYYKSSFPAADEDSLAGGLSNTIAGRISKFLDTLGGCYIVDGACSSSLLAVDQAATNLTNGNIDIAVAGGVDISLDTFELIGFSKAGALTQGDMTVYDRRGSGFMPGEGAGFVVLKRLEDAQRDKNYIYAVVKGTGVSSDGAVVGMTAPSSDGQAKALRRAYEKAPYDMDSICFVEGHGTGTTLGDRVELEAVSKAIGEDLDCVGEKGRFCGMTSLKSIVGHTKAASGVGGFLKAVIGLNRRVIPPTAACRDPHPIFDTTARCLYPVMYGKIMDPGEKIRAGASGMGFGGINCHVTAESGDAPSPRLTPSIDERALLVSNQETEIFVLTGTTLDSLAQKAGELKTAARDIAMCEMADLAAKLGRESEASAVVRAAVIADHPEDLMNKFEQLESAIKENKVIPGKIFQDPTRSIWVAPQADQSEGGPKIGMLFPGQGSQKLTMARTLVERFQWARDMVADADEMYAKVNPDAEMKLSELIFRAVNKTRDQEEVKDWFKTLSQTENAQPAICLASMLWHRFISDMGITPSAVCGHSLGELTAFQAAGAFDVKRLFHLASLRGRAMAPSGGEAGTMASLRCGREKAEAIRDQASGYVVLANINAPTQMILSGEKSAIDDVFNIAANEGIQVVKLKVSNAFHSKMAAAAADVLKDKADLPDTYAPGAVRLFTSTTGKEVEAGLALRDHFSGQVLHQVDFISTVNSMAEACDILVEVGPGRVLTGLSGQITGDDKPDSFCLESKPLMDKDLNTTLAALFINGARIKWDALYENRLIRPFAPASERVFIINPCEKELADVQVAAAAPLQAGAATGALESMLGGMVDLSGDEFEEYLSNRAPYLAEMIRTDFKYAAPGAGPSAPRVDFAPPAAAAVSAPAALAALPAAPAAPASGESLLYGIIQEATGFPPETLSHESRLLDDLNLDSIKAADVIHKFAEKSNVTGKVDPSTMANATLGEILGTIAAAAPAPAAPVAAAAPPPAASGESLLYGIIQNATGFPPETLSHDSRLLDDLNLDSIKAADVIHKFAEESNVTGKVDPSTMANATLGEILDSIAAAAPAPAIPEAAAAPAAPAGGANALEDFLLSEVERITGFPKDGLSLDLRILDDLNLDSIKAGDLVVQAGRFAGLDGKIEDLDLGSATLSDIRDAVALQMGEVETAAPAPALEPKAPGMTEAMELAIAEIVRITGYPRETLDPDLLLQKDLGIEPDMLLKLVVNLSRALKIEPVVDLEPIADRTLKQVASVFERITKIQREQKPITVGEEPDSWVRDFKVDLVEEAFPSLPPWMGKRREDNWEFSNALILCAPDTIEVSESMRNALFELGAQVTTATFEEAMEEKLADDPSYTHLVAILPQTPDRFDSNAEALKNAVSDMASAATPPPAARAPRRRTTVAYVQFGGGFFGQKPQFAHYDQCAALAFTSSLHLERSDLRVRIMDFSPALDVDQITANAIKEIYTPDPFAAVGYDFELTRRVVKHRVLQPAEYKPREIEWTGDDVIMVTGGAKGITASCALRLARFINPRMALLGRTPHPDDQPDNPACKEIVDMLKKYENRGIQARYYSCDVADLAVMKHTVERIREDLGPITGVIHGAGVNKPRLASQVSVKDAYWEVCPKVLGALNIIEALGDKPPKMFAGLSSIIGVTGMQGNAWYAFSNEALDLLLRAYEADNPDTRTVSIAYSIWRDEGMGAKMGSVTQLKRVGIDAIPTEEGVKRFARIFLRDPGVHQPAVVARFGGLDTWRLDALPDLEDARYLEEPVHITPGVESAFSAHLSLEQDPYIRDHDFDGSYLMPTVFGLEAMAQAAAHASGVHDFSRVRIEDVSLRRPITADPRTGADIVVRAEVLEKSLDNDLIVVKAGVAKSQTGIQADFFSATFILGLPDEELTHEIALADKPLPVNPKLDLYRPNLCFQGPLFHLITEFHAYTEDKGIYISSRAPDKDALAASFPKAPYKTLMLGDAFFRDSLLHTAQLLVPEAYVLPVHIDRLDVYPRRDVPAAGPADEPDVMRVIITKEGFEKEGREVVNTVIAVDAGGVVREKLDRYSLALLKNLDENPAVADLNNPDERDNGLVKDALAGVASSLKLEAPELLLRYMPGVHDLEKEARRDAESAVMKEAVNHLLEKTGAESREFNISWLESGKPVVTGGAETAISVSHDDRLCVCAAGAGPQGCDIAPIAHRTRPEWSRVLGSDKDDLLEELINASDHLDQAGTRVMTLVEAFQRAADQPPESLSVSRTSDEVVVFECGAGDKIAHILTLPLNLTWGPRRMLALAVADKSVKRVEAPPMKAELPMAAEVGPKPSYLDGYKDLFESHHFEMLLGEGPHGQDIFVFRFPVAFKPNMMLSRTVYYSNYFFWLGELREISIWPILDRVAAMFGTGEWGAVTNETNMTILGEATARDIIEIYLWVSDNGGPTNSTMDLTFDFRKITPDGKYERIAWCIQQITWVKILEHGKVAPKPYPDFYWDLVKNLLPKYEAPNEREPMRESLSGLLEAEGNDLLYQSPPGPIIVQPVIHDQDIETSLDNSNLVGNVYYATYYLWQGQTRDKFLHNIDPTLFHGTGVQGESLCLESHVFHLREAMPFDKIACTMHLKKLNKYSAEFTFEYFRREPDGSRIKIAVGDQVALWVTRDAEGNPVPSPFPAKVQAVFNAAIAKAKK